MKIKLLLITSLACFSINTFADNTKFNAALAQVIQSNDYVCNYVNKSFKAKQTHRGKEIDVQCNGGKYLYRVIVTPSKKFIVEVR